MEPKQSIPLHFLTGDNRDGIHLHKIEATAPDRLVGMEAHRDDHCNFFFQVQGQSSFMVDFRQFSLDGSGIFCVFPGQVHWPVSIANASGWLLAVDRMLIGNVYRELFEEYVTDGNPIKINANQSDQLISSLTMLDHLKTNLNESGFRQQIIADMIQVCIGLFAMIVLGSNKYHPTHHSRPSMIAQNFRKLLRKEYKSIKSPAAYAHLLNITPSYLSEAVTSETGLPAGYWIHQEVMLEAKRLLYYTDLGVKEIAFSLGYEDHAYFSRLFKKVIGLSPGQFRNQYRK